MRVIKTAGPALAFCNVERILWIRERAASADTVKYLAGCIDRVAEGVASSGRYSVPGLHVEPRLHAVVIGHPYVVTRENPRLIAVRISCGETRGSRRRARSEVGRNQISVSSGDERIECWVCVHVLE